MKLRNSMDKELFDDLVFDIKYGFKATEIYCSGEQKNDFIKHVLNECPFTSTFSDCGENSTCDECIENNIKFNLLDS